MYLGVVDVTTQCKRVLLKCIDTGSQGAGELQLAAEVAPETVDQLSYSVLGKEKGQVKKRKL